MIRNLLILSASLRVMDCIVYCICYVGLLGYSDLLQQVDLTPLTRSNYSKQQFCEFSFIRNFDPTLWSCYDMMSSDISSFTLPICQMISTGFLVEVD